jgi:hypothetical protein
MSGICQISQKHINENRSQPVIPILLAAIILISTVSCSSNGSQADYDQAYAIGLQAYTYGLPLLETNKTFLTMTSINVSNGTGYGPVNQFNHVRRLNDPKNSAVVAPGANGLSSIAWLDLTDEPQVLQIPLVTDHFFALALLDPYTEDIQNLGSAHATPPGDYVICGPGQHELAIPAGTHRIDVAYTRIWIIGSTQLFGAEDLATVNKIQDGYTLTPLSQYGTSFRAPAPETPDTIVDQATLPTGVEFFDLLGQLLAQFPPPKADQAVLDEFAVVGIGPGRTPSHDQRLSAATLRGLSDAAAAGPARIQKDARDLFVSGAKKHNGYFLGGFGQYGTDYKLRAVVAQIGLGAMSSDQTIFAMAMTDHIGKPLTGNTSYVIHLPTIPPASEGWSLTAYNLKGALIPNSLNRYQFNNNSPLKMNPDGSMDIYVQTEQPSDPALAGNWLPTASEQGFELIWRLLAPDPAEINGILDGTGWQPPAIIGGN